VPSTVQLDKVPEEGVPSAGVTSVGLLDKTTLPVPVEVVTPVPPLATAKVADNPAAVPVVFWFKVGNVQFAKLPDVGVPSNGVTNVGEVAKTTAPEPVLEVIVILGVVPPLEAKGDDAVTLVIVPPEPVAAIV